MLPLGRGSGSKTGYKRVCYGTKIYFALKQIKRGTFVKSLYDTLRLLYDLEPGLQ